MVPRRPVTTDPNAVAAKAAKDAKAKGKDDKGNPEGETPQPPADPDARLLFDAHLTGTEAITKIITEREAEEEVERQRELEKEKERLAVIAAANKKGGKGGKKGKSRSPSPKWGKEKEGGG